jgi:ADP-ribose pyrophosphatase
VRRDRVTLPTGEVVRDYVEHPGAVAIVALDDRERVFVLQQYRHPIGTHEWELPAGLLDVPGEPPVRCAQRELHEEADLVAGRWHHLLSYHSSPGGITEVLHLFLARDLSPVPEDERHVRTDEEAGMPTRWVPLSDLRAAVLAGEVGNAALIIGTLVTDEARRHGFADLEPAGPDALV